MSLTKSIKRDPLGAMDTRLIMTDPSVNDFYSTSVPFTGLLDAVAQGLPDKMKAETSPRQEYRILELHNSFNGFASSQECPRLELDVAVDKYHLLDGLTGPLDPQNTPASNSAHESTPRSSQYIPKSLQGNPTIHNFGLDCFQDSLQRTFFSHQGDRSEPAKPPKPSPLPDNQKQWFRTSDTKLGDNRPAHNSSFPQRLGDPNPGIRCVRFSPPLSTHRTTRSPMPSIERERDYVALYRHKQQCQKWKIARRPVCRRGPPSRSPALKVQGLKTPKLDGPDMCNPMSSGLPSLKLKRPPFLVQSSLGTDAAKVTACKAPNASVAGDSKITHTIQQNDMFINISFSLYKLRNAPHALPGKVPKYAFEFRTIETEMINLPEHPFLRFPDGLEHTIGPVAVDDLIFHTSFIMTSLVVKLPLNILSTVTRHLTNTQAGNVILYLAKTLISLITHAAVFMLSLFGVYFNCQWLQDTGHLD